MVFYIRSERMVTGAGNTVKIISLCCSTHAPFSTAGAFYPHIRTVILDSRREEHANNERHRYHTAFSLDDMTYEDKDYFSVDDNPEEALMRKEAAKERKAMLSRLTPVQRRRFEKFEDGMSIAEIARSEKAAFNSVKESIESAQKKLKKLL